MRRLRQEQNLTLQQLSDKLSALGHAMGLSLLSKAETRERRIDVDDLVAIACALGSTPHDLLFGSAPAETLISEPLAVFVRSIVDDALAEARHQQPGGTSS
jgi:transcriptional regulator with XRE-family HTH domain